MYDIPKWEINGLEFEYDFDDADAMDRYGEAFKHLRERMESYPLEGLKADQIRFESESMFILFDDLFGPGTAEDLFHGKANLRIIYQVYDSFLEFVEKNVNRGEEERLKHYQNFKKRKKKR